MNSLQSSHSLTAQWQRIERQLQRNCDQLDVINRHIDVIKCRYERSSRNGNQALQYQLHLQVNVMEGVRAALYEYGVRKAQQMRALWKNLQEHIVASPQNPNNLDQGANDLDRSYEIDSSPN